MLRFLPRIKLPSKLSKTGCAPRPLFRASVFVDPAETSLPSQSGGNLSGRFLDVPRIPGDAQGRAVTQKGWWLCTPQ